MAGNNTITGGSTLGQMQQAMALAQAGTGLANSMNAGQAAPGTSDTAPSMWENVTGAVQNITGLGGSTGTGPSKLGGDEMAKSGNQPALGDVPEAPNENVPRHHLPSSLGAASEGDTLVTGLGGPPEAGAASRAPSAARAKPGEGLGADVKGSAKKKKGAAAGGDAPACPPGQDCAALAATGVAFSKGGSLGVPVVGASDPSLNVTGALDGLFGELPTLDANGNPTAPAAMAEGGFGEIEIDAATGLIPGGGQGSPEVAPANSRTLFARVRGAHEKALKKGAISLFHKKL